MLDIETMKKKMCKIAFDWAVNEIARAELKPPVKELTFEPGFTMPSPEEYVYSAFVGGDKCVVRKDWLNESPEYVKTECQIITNWSQIEADYPEIAEQMLENGFDLYIYFEGGPTRKMNKTWDER